MSDFIVKIPCINDLPLRNLPSLFDFRSVNPGTSCRGADPNRLAKDLKAKRSVCVYLAHR